MVSVSSLDIDEAVRLLADVRRQATQIVELPELARPATVDQGYAIQDALVRALDSPVVGWKVGCTGPAAQAKVGAREPFAGRIFKDQVRSSPGTIGPSESHLRAIQLEFAFQLGKNLDGASAPFDRDRVAAAVVAVIPTIEIADCRFLDWTRVGAPSLIADNAKEGLIVFGTELGAWRGIDLAAEKVRLLVNGRQITEGTGARVLGDPLRSLLWLANDRVRRGDFLSAGQIVSTGTCIDSYYAAPGDAVVAEFESLQPVQVSFARS